MIKYSLEKGKFILEDYDKAETFSDFMPAIAGVDGVPMWVYFVNRGQCVCTFGADDKNNSIVEFLPANKSLMTVERFGFRTFIKTDEREVELFADEATAKKMISGNEQLVIEEILIGFSAKVTYAQLCGEEFPALIRKLTITNTSQKTMELTCTDGLAQIVCYGMSDAVLKNVSNLTNAYSNAEESNGSMIYKEDYSTADHAKVTEIRGANFYRSTCLGKQPYYIYDPMLIFGRDSSYKTAKHLLGKTSEEIRAFSQTCVFKMPSAFSCYDLKFEVGQSVDIYSVVGTVKDISQMEQVEECFEKAEQYEERISRNKAVIDAVTDNLCCETGNELLNEYFSQCFFDNVLRGGMPIKIADGKGGYTVHYVFSRKHGDLEREYNWFVIPATKYSGGTGNYRDVCQNRRNDAIFFPFVGDYNIKMFYNMLQLDGYNPLCIEQPVFLPSSAAKDIYDLCKISKKDIEKISGGLTAGELAKYFPNNLGEFLALCEVKFCARFAEGYWTDHFTYNLDLVENYLLINPDKERDLLFKDDYTYFVSGVKVLPLSKRLVPQSDGKLYAYASISEEGKDGILTDVNGETITIKLLAKMVGCSLIKTATLDNDFSGIEMEGGKPGWNDSMNGLPGLNASSVPEAMELYRLNEFIIEKCNTYDTVELLAEQAELFVRLAESVDREDRYESFLAAREDFRANIYNAVNGKKVFVLAADLGEFLDNVNKRIRAALNKSLIENNGVYPTFIIYDIQEKDGKLCYTRKNISAFLEANAKSLKLKDFGDAKALHAQVLKSGMYDKRLKVYKTSESLECESPMIGRVRTFKPGLYERESCFLHMHYKYLLGLLESGLYDDFYQNIYNGFTCFMDAKTYGRSVLQNSSFIVSSACSDEELIGRGFQPRLTGANAEVLTMIIKMFLGEKLFSLEDGKLTFTFQPKIKADLFDKNNQVKLKLFGDTCITFINGVRVDTYSNSATITKIDVYDGKECKTIVGGVLYGQDAENLRSGKFKTVDVTISSN